MNRQISNETKQTSMMDFAATTKRNHPSDSDGPSSKKTSQHVLTQRGGEWVSNQESSLLVYTSNGVEGRTKIAGFDFDGTLVSTKSGNVFPKDSTDWKLWNKQKVVAKLRELYADGYKIVIFTNQRGILTGKTDKSAFKNKIVNVSKALQVPIQVFVSTGKVDYRKPFVQMWIELEDRHNDGVQIDRSASIYCGDAAGRLATATRKADHSCADRAFALNLGVPFMTPEQMFLGQLDEEPYKLPAFDPVEYLSETRDRFVPVDTQFPHDENKQELIVMVGASASGKSHISRMLQDNGYEVVNQDSLRSKISCENMVKRLLREGKNIVVDNTNRDKNTRKSYLEEAKKKGSRCRAIIMNCPKEMAQHNNIFREIMGTDIQHTGITTFVVRGFYNALEDPTHDEGFDDIIQCNFVPDFPDEESRQIYNLILSEK